MRAKRPQPKKKSYLCIVSGKPIPARRVAALIKLGIPETQWTLVEYSLVKKVQGIFMGEHGASELKIVSKVYNDSVRGVFEKPDDLDTSGPADNALEDDEKVCDNPLKGDSS